MRSLLVNLPDDIFKATSKAAKKLGLSKTAFIRLAITHELEGFESKLEQISVIKSLNAMKKSKKYMLELKEIDNGFTSSLPEEKGEWWKQKNY